MINLPVCYAVATILDIQSTKNTYLIMEDLRHIPSRFWFQMVQCILQLLILNYFPHGALSNKNNRGSMWGDLIIVRSFLPWCLFWCCCPFTRALLSTLIRCIRSGDSPVLTVTKHSFWWLTSTHGYKTFVLVTHQYSRLQNIRSGDSPVLTVTKHSTTSFLLILQQRPIRMLHSG
jgi:hypothetical protein